MGKEVVYFLYITLWSYLSQSFLVYDGGSEVWSHSYLQPQYHHLNPTWMKYVLVKEVNKLGAYLCIFMENKIADTECLYWVFLFYFDVL